MTPIEPADPDALRCHQWARLQALMAPPAPESPAQNVAETVVAAKIVDEVIEETGRATEAYSFAGAARIGATGDLFALTRTGFGDGTYEIAVGRDRDGGLAAVAIVFDVLD